MSPDYRDDRTVLVSARGRELYRSTDGGTTWDPTGDDLLIDNLVLSNFYHSTSEPIVFSPNYAADHTVFGFDGTTLLRSADGGESWDEIDRPVTEHETTEESAPGPLRTTPRFGVAEQPTTDETELTADETEFTTRKLLFAALCAAASFLVLWTAERAGGRWRWIIRFATPIAVFGGVLWVLLRR